MQCNTPSGERRPPTPLPVARPAGLGDSALRAYALLGTGRKLAADAGSCDGRARAGLARGQCVHLLQASIGRVEVDAAVASEPQAVAVGLRVAQRHATAVHELPGVFSAARHMIEQPYLPATRGKVWGVADVYHGPARRQAEQCLAATWRVEPLGLRAVGKIDLHDAVEERPARGHLRGARVVRVDGASPR